MQNCGRNVSSPSWHETRQHSSVSSQTLCQEKVIDQCAEDMVSRGVAEKRSSPWGSPVTIVARKDGQPCFCVDYRRTLNKLLIRKPWPMATLERKLDSLGAARFISVADVATAFWQIPVHPDHVERTAFVTSRGKYCFNRMPFGLCNATWLFTKMTQKTLGHIPEPLIIYTDDLCVLSATWESHVSSLENLQLAYETAHSNLQERTENQARPNANLTFPSFQAPQP